CAVRKLPRCSRRSNPRLPQHVLRHCPPAPWPKPRTTHWRFGRNSLAFWNTRNSNSATTLPKTLCALSRSAAKTGSISAASKPDPRSPPSSPSSKAAAASTPPCAITWRRSSPVSPIRSCITSPNSHLPHGLLNTISPLHNHAAPVNHVFALTHTIDQWERQIKLSCKGTSLLASARLDLQRSWNSEFLMDGYSQFVASFLCPS